MRFKTRSNSEFQNEEIARRWAEAAKYGKWHKRFVWFYREPGGRIAIMETMWCRCYYFNSTYWGPIENFDIRSYRFIEDVPADLDEPSRWEYPTYSTGPRFP